MNYVLSEEEFKLYVHKDRLRVPIEEAEKAIGQVMADCAKWHGQGWEELFDLQASCAACRPVMSQELKQIFEILETLKVKLSL